MSDIVERLRARQVTNWVHATGQTPRASGKRTDPLCAAAADEIERLTAEVAGLREDADGWKESRDMFVARLENMALQGDKWLTIAAVMMLLYDCDMLAALEQVPTTPHPSPSPRS